ncbi:MAG: enoyl-CoA hydratase-related protein [Gammaproteobacteria bacterium]|nr:enoyl-CoA hydratase-related protein [Gammaproteobacteria bacterium]MDH3466569.1 enoyl-CoA hydratase-related protein [Gammaproteobacteria bacterium]
MSEAVRIERNDALLEITLDRPKANAIDNATSRLMGQTFCEFRDDPSLRVAILTAAGDKFFSAGWDLKAASEGEAADVDYGPGGFAGLTELHDLNKPVIAAVNGMAVGGGFELALCADFIVATRHAEFFLPEVFVSILPDAATFRLPKMLPRPIAMEMLMAGRHMDADEAARWGLVNRVVAADALLPEARKLAQSIVAAAPLAVAAVKEMARLTAALPIEQCYRVMHNGESPAYETLRKSADAEEGPRAFAEKREPRWSGC